MAMKAQPKPKDPVGHAKQPSPSKGAVKPDNIKTAAPHRTAVSALIAHGEGHSEGKNTEPVAGQQHTTPNFGMAAHHNVAYDAGRQAHQFRPPSSGQSHGFGYAAHQRSGMLRTSGKAGAHRVGHRGK